MTEGRFISLEGGEGVGKSTQGRLLAAWLRGHGLDVILTREPGGSPGAEAIRGLLLGGDGDRWSARAEALLFAAARSDHVDRVIKPALARGAWIICDRFIDSSRAYQSAEGAIDDAAIMDLHRIGSGNLLPHRTLYFKMPPHSGLDRARARDAGASDRIGGRGDAFHVAVVAAFDRFAAAEPDRFRIIDAGGTIDDVQQGAQAALRDLLP